MLADCRVHFDRSQLFSPQQHTAPNFTFRNSALCPTLCIWRPILQETAIMLVNNFSPTGLCNLDSVPLSVSLYQCSILIFVLILLSEGQAGESRELPNKAMRFRISGGTGQGNTPAIQHTSRHDLRPLLCHTMNMCR